MEKKFYINALTAVLEIAKGSEGKEEDQYLTYVTANGIVTGKPVRYDEVDISNDEAFEESVNKRILESNGIDIYSLTHGFFMKNYKELDGVENPSIPLEDVKIKFPNGSILNVDTYILFADQIIGILPGKASIEDWKDPQ
ncbi:hypothetical protein 7F23_57 [uncultured Caudovirales phage]|uniref:Uncharacterized protein n=1 Tax=uncultured Caudovirales phage TaxID=2100421 RepID=A0A2H4J261_9CAUD|nr:hypothetical protein 7F23_57 [uncultured Caudovirales phage]